MMRTMTILGAGLIGLMHPTASHAGPLDFMFSFTGAEIVGTVTGEIFGLTDNTTGQAATNVILDSYPPALGLSAPPLTTFSSIQLNSFTVMNGDITDATFDAFDTSGTTELQLNCCNKQNDLNALFVDSGRLGTFNSGGFSGVTYTPVTVPAPLLATGPVAASVTLLATGLATLWPLRRRLRRRAASV